MKWITREHVKVDRVACPWLIRKFIDKDAEFVFVARDKVMDEAKRLDAIPYDVPNVELGHHGQECSFEAIVKASCHVPDFILLDGLLGELDVADTLRLLGTCPVTAHIPIFRLSPGRRVPRRVLAAALAQP